MPLLTSLIALNPEIEKHSFLNKKSLQLEDYLLEDEVVDLKKTYFYTYKNHYDKMDLLKEHISDIFKSIDKSLKISSDVLSQGYFLIDNLYPSILEDLDNENIYSTPYGTLVFDWEKDNDNVFSLEIGASKIGYFIEIDGKDIKQVDSKSFQESQSHLFRDLSSFLA